MVGLHLPQALSSLRGRIQPPLFTDVFLTMPGHNLLNYLWNEWASCKTGPLICQSKWTDTGSPLHMNLQAANFQRCERVFVCPNTKVSSHVWTVTCVHPLQVVMLLCTLLYSPIQSGLPRWLSGNESACQCRRCRFGPWEGEDSLDEEMITHSSILAWEIPWTEEPGGLQSMGSQKSQTGLSC